jgi:2-polyprenyl-3-methyl-5-hydroxy-6-metoxy-1,4-benzoquinol methylase
VPSVLENQARWTEHPWEREGHEWSPGQTAAGGEMLWWRGLLPRIAMHLPVASILEIGPGFGRWTQQLLRHCDQLTAIDLTERCVEHCRVKFASHPGFTAWTNDGESLDVVPDESVDFVFSFDSLVHAEAPVLRSYLRQLARKLRPGGSGFIHHSNVRALTGPNGTVPSWLTRTNWRGQTMSARLFREYCAEAGLLCQTQEVINWISRSQRADRHRPKANGLPLTDVMSTFVRPGGTLGRADVPQRRTRVYVNPGFADEWRQIVLLTSLYGRQDEAPKTHTAPSARVRPSLAARAKDKATFLADYWGSYARDHGAAWRASRREPIVNALRRGRCPDCGAATSGGTGSRQPSRAVCDSCRVEFVADCR